MTLCKTMVFKRRKYNSESVTDMTVNNSDSVTHKKNKCDSDIEMTKSRSRTILPSFFKRKAPKREPEFEQPPDVYLKIVLLGDCRSGKTTLAFKFSNIACKTSFPKRPANLNMSTMEYIDSIIRVAEKKVLVRLYDTAGQEKFRSLTASYYRGAHGCLVLYDVTKESTFNNLTYWLHDLKEYSTHPEISTIIVGTKCHVTPEEREVSYDRALKFAESVGLPYMEVSAEEGRNVTEVFEKLADSIIENLTKDSTPNMQQPNRVILSEQHKPKPKKQWCSC